MGMFKKKRAASIMEYLALLAMLISALFIFQHYVVRAMSGSWKKAGDAFGQGRQYDPRKFGVSGETDGTLRCYFDSTHCDPTAAAATPCTVFNLWISMECMETNGCDCTLLPTDVNYPVRCLSCLSGCSERAAGRFCADL